MARPVTDREILKAIYDTYHTEFSNFDEDNATRESKIFVPIDCAKIARKLKVDPDSIFGRLYYHLDKKHGYTSSNGTPVKLFTRCDRANTDAVNFPLLEAIYAETHTSYFRFLMPLFLSVIALCYAILSSAPNTSSKASANEVRQCDITDIDSGAVR